MRISTVPLTWLSSFEKEMENTKNNRRRERKNRRILNNPGR
jgi:hypothetical protein